MMAVVSNDIAGVEFYSKTSREKINQKNIGGATSLHIAARNGNFEIAEILIKNGADVNIADNEGYTALMRACLAKSDKIVNILLQRNSDSSVMNNNFESAIINASSSDCVNCLKLILQKGDLNATNPELLREQLAQSFAIATKRDNKEIQNLLQTYLNSMTERTIKKKSKIVKENYKEENKIKYVLNSLDIADTTTERIFEIKEEEGGDKKVLENKENKTIYHFIAKPDYQKEEEVVVYYKSQKEPIIYKFKSGPKKLKRKKRKKVKIKNVEAINELPPQHSKEEVIIKKEVKTEIEITDKDLKEVDKIIEQNEIKEKDDIKLQK